MYKNPPAIVTKIDTIIPIPISFLINPKSLIFESCGEPLNQTEQVQ